MKKFLEYLPILSVGVFTFFLGLLIGMVYQESLIPVSLNVLQTIQEERLAVITLEELSPLGIKGQVSGNSVRLFAGQEVLNIQKGENFKFATKEVFRNIQSVIPENTQFFASQRGKKFYSIKDTKQLENIRPENLIFFNTEAEAKSAGFEKSS